MKLNSEIPRFRAIARQWLADGSRFVDGQPRYIEDVTVGACAWDVAHRCGILRECWALGCNDAHIRSALKRIFPNAVFREDKSKESQSCHQN